MRLSSHVTLNRKRTGSSRSIACLCDGMMPSADSFLILGNERRWCLAGFDRELWVLAHAIKRCCQEKFTPVCFSQVSCQKDSVLFPLIFTQHFSDDSHGQVELERICSSERTPHGQNTFSNSLLLVCSFVKRTGPRRWFPLHALLVFQLRENMMGWNPSTLKL